MGFDIGLIVIILLLGAGTVILEIKVRKIWAGRDQRVLELCDEVDEVDRERLAAIQEGASRVLEVEQQRDASQRSVDELSAALKSERERKVALQRKVTTLHQIHEELGKKIQVIYAELKLRDNPQDWQEGDCFKPDGRDDLPPRGIRSNKPKPLPIRIKKDGERNQ